MTHIISYIAYHILYSHARTLNNRNDLPIHYTGCFKKADIRFSVTSDHTT